MLGCAKEEIQQLFPPVTAHLMCLSHQECNTLSDYPEALLLSQLQHSVALMELWKQWMKQKLQKLHLFLLSSGSWKANLSLHPQHLLRQKRVWKGVSEVATTQFIGKPKQLLVLSWLVTSWFGDYNIIILRSANHFLCNDRLNTYFNCNP